jgi:hypothetical protein
MSRTGLPHSNLHTNLHMTTQVGGACGFMQIRCQPTPGAFPARARHNRIDARLMIGSEFLCKNVIFPPRHYYRQVWEQLPAVNGQNRHRRVSKLQWSSSTENGHPKTFFLIPLIYTSIWIKWYNIFSFWKKKIFVTKKTWFYQILTIFFFLV